MDNDDKSSYFTEKMQCQNSICWKITSKQFLTKFYLLYENISNLDTHISPFYYRNTHVYILYTSQRRYKILLRSGQLICEQKTKKTNKS